MWDSQQCSQTASGSQNSQGSYELFSQPLRQSQQRGSAYDKWSQPGSSQQTNEGESMKYYLKYMAKPSLFSDKDKQGNDKPFSHVPSYKEHIEIQKKKTAERDERDMLDSFIALLKDYQKEVKTALDSFKENVDSTLAKKAEEIVAGADQSTGLIANLKEELKEHFHNLRNEMEEHQRLRETIAKQETKLEQQGTQLRLLQDQLDDCRSREKRAVLKEQSYLEREKELTSKLKELNATRPSVLRDTPPMSQQSNTGNEAYPVSRTESMNQSECQRGAAFSTVMLHHLPPQELSQAPVVPDSSCQPHPPVATCLYQQQNITNQLRPTSEASAFQVGRIMVPTDTQSASSLQYGTEHVLPLSTGQQNMCYYPARDNKLTSCIGPAKVIPIQQDGQGKCHKPSTAVESFTCNDHGQEAFGSSALATKAGNQLNRSIGFQGNDFASPGNNHIPYFRAVNWPKQSPVATVYPQVQVKAEDCQTKSKRSAQPCQRKNKVEDPFDIFTFDLTDTSGTANDENVENSTAQREPQMERHGHMVKRTSLKTYNTRSRQEATLKLVAGQLNNNNNNNNDKEMSTANRKRAHINAVKKVYMKSVNVTHQQACDEDDSQGIEISFSSPPDMVALTRKNGENQGEQGKKNSSKKPKQALFRRAHSAKRKLPSGSSLFDIVDDDEDDVSIQKITESLRKHSQQRKLKKMKSL